MQRLNSKAPVDEERQLTSALLSWYRREGRELPWRKTNDPYRIWVSEVMLQQTQVSRVVVYYQNFLKRFPTLLSLSRATWAQVLPCWRGLGYYQRGRNLLQTAKLVVAEHQGRFPHVEQELRALPGIGVYTARAIQSFAFGQAVPALDTNIRRVLLRVFGEGEPLESKAKLIYSRRPKRGAELNHAFMDLGAALCTSREMLCAQCPLSKICLTARQKLSSGFQETKKGRNRKLKRVDIHVGAACIHSEGKYLIAKRSRVRGGEWEFPGGKKEPGEDIRACLKREILEELGVEISVRPAFQTFDFVKNGKAYRLHFCRAQILKGVPRKTEHARIVWVKGGELGRYRFAATNREAVRSLLSPGYFKKPSAPNGGCRLRPAGPKSRPSHRSRREVS